MNLHIHFLPIVLLTALGIVHADIVPVPVEAGRFYEVTIPATLSTTDATNQNPVAICTFRFSGSGGIPIRADDSLVSTMLPGDRYAAYDYLFADRASLTDKTNAVWVLQARVPALADTMSLDIRPWKNLAPVKLAAPTVRPCEPTYDFLGGDRRIRRAFRCGENDDELVLSGTVLEDGAETPQASLSLHIDVSLWGTELDVKGRRRRGPPTRTTSHIVETDAEGRFRLTVPLPDGCMGGTAEISAPEESSRVRLFTPGAGARFAPQKLPSQREPLVYVFPVSDADRMTLSGVLQGDGTTQPTPKGGLVAVAFETQVGEPLRANDLPRSELYGDYFYLEIPTDTASFRKEFAVPATADRVVFRVSRFYNDLDVSLQSLSLQRRFPSFKPGLLDAWLGEGVADALCARTDRPDASAENFGVIMESSWRPGPDPGVLSFRNYPDVPVSSEMDWLHLPVQSSSWALKFYSCYWIPFTTANLPPAERYERCKALWRSFLRSCAYAPARFETPMYNDHTCAARAEAILLTIYGSETARVPLGSLQDFFAKDPEFFRDLMTQLSVDVGVVAYHLRRRTFDLHNHNLIMAKSLLVFADCFPDSDFAVPYRTLANGVIQEHLHAMFEPDGVLREQSTLYHHTFYGYFSDLYTYLMKTPQKGDARLQDMHDLLVTMLDADRHFCPPDGETIPTGDTGMSRIQGHADVIVSRVEDVTGRDEDFHHPLGDGPSASAYPESGLYVFRNPAEGNYLFIDISPVLKVHGHRDLGSWQYYAQGERWMSDLGGPYRYGTPEYRRFIASESHTLIEPSGREQTAGVAYGVDFRETDEGYVLEFRTNVYGPGITHKKRFEIRKDVSSFRVKETFDGLPDGRFHGRLILAEGVTAECDGNNVRLSRDGKSLSVRLSPACGNIHMEPRDSSPNSNRLVPVETVVFSEKTANASAHLTLEVGGKP